MTLKNNDKPRFGAGGGGEAKGDGGGRVRRVEESKKAEKRISQSGKG